MLQGFKCMFDHLVDIRHDRVKVKVLDPIGFIKL